LLKAEGYALFSGVRKMITYTIPEVLNNIDSHLAAALLAGIMIFVGAFIQYFEGIRLGFRHKTHAIPVFANMYFFAHDLLFVGLFTHWFVEVNHWLFKLFWVGIVIFTVLECVVHYQTIKFSRSDLFPGLNQQQYIIVYVALQVVVVALFWFIYSHLDDPLFLISFATTEIISNVFNIPMLLKRRSRQGQSFLLAWGLLLGSNISFFFLFLPLLSNSTESLLAKALERSRTLHASGSIAQAELDRSVAELDRASYERKALEQRLALLQRGARREEIERAKARVESSASALALADARLARHEVQAMHGGVVLDVHVEGGELAAPGTPVATIADVGHPFVDVFVP
jgi:hypothetical protein